MNWKLVRIVAVTCLVLHSAYAIFGLFYVQSSDAMGDELWWCALFGDYDDPAAAIGHTFARDIIPFTRPLVWVGEKTGFSPMNVHWFQVHLVFGGLQWTFWGFAVGCALSAIIDWLKNSKTRWFFRGMPPAR